MGEYGGSFYLCVFIYVSWGPFRKGSRRRRAGRVGALQRRGQPAAGLCAFAAPRRAVLVAGLLVTAP
eukprot:2979667-Pyramimonas_sp.AAC.1